MRRLTLPSFAAAPVRWGLPLHRLLFILLSLKACSASGASVSGHSTYIDFVVVSGEPMVESPPPSSPVAPDAPIESNRYEWVQEVVARHASEYTSASLVERFPRLLTDARRENYVVVEPCVAGESICYRPPPGDEDRFTFVYETMFTKLGVKLPFSDFECGMLRALNIAPSQLHPNSWGFLRAFTILCHGIGSEPSVGLFLSFFQAKSSPKVG